jgi:hypothetical protein
MRQIKVAHFVVLKTQKEARKEERKRRRGRGRSWDRAYLSRTHAQ